MEITDHLIWGMFFGIIGYGYFSYGKKQKSAIPFFTGITLFVFPYAIPSVNMLIATGFLLSLTPYILKKMGY